MPRFLLTIDNTKVSGSSHTNFVYMFTEGTANIPGGFWDHISDPVNGLDVRFFSLSQNELAREVVTVDVDSQKVEAWVQIPILSGSQDTLIWCYYGGYTRPNDTTLWSAIDVGGVWHLQGNANDSSGNGNTGSLGNTPTEIDAVIRKGYNFDEDNQENIAVSDANSLDLISNFTISFWARRTTDTDGAFVTKDSDTRGRSFFIDHVTTVQGLRFYAFINDSTLRYIVEAFTMSTGTWYYVQCIHSGTDIELWVNGTEYGAASGSISAVQNSTADVQMGSMEYSSARNWFDGDLDEVRLIDRVLSEDWRDTEYSNQNSPSTFSGADQEVTSERTVFLVNSETVSPSVTEDFQIAIDASKVSGTSHTNFPYLFSESVPNIPGAFWTHVADANGLDIRFFAADGRTELKREIVSFDSATQKIEAWVQIPNLSGSTDTKIWCRYGGATRSNDTEVWDDVGAEAIWHHQGNADDSTANANTGTVSGATETDGKIQKAYYFDGADYINVSAVAGDMDASKGSVSVWAKRETFSDARHMFAHYNSGNRIYLYINGGQFIAGLGTTSAINTGDYPVVGEWNHFALTWDSGSYVVYYNGSQTASGSYSGLSSINVVGVGAAYVNPSWTQHYKGDIDEVHVYSEVRNGDWFATEYTNQNSPETFSTVNG